MGSAEVELFLTAIAAMLSPTTLTFSVLALVLGERPIRTGTWFYLGALGATLLVGVVAAFVLEDVAAGPAGQLPAEDVGGDPRPRARRALRAVLRGAAGSQPDESRERTADGRQSQQASPPRPRSRSSGPARRSRTRAASSRSR